MSFVAVVHNNHLTFNGIQYFRASAESLTIGTYGEKRTPLTGQNYLEAQADIPAPKLVVRTATIVDIDFTKSRSADIKLGLKVAGNQVDADTAFSNLKAGKLKLVKLEMRLGDVKDAVNASPQVLGDLRSYGHDARVCQQIFVIMEATLAQTFSNATNIGFSRDSGTLRLTANAGTSGSGGTAVSLSAGTTYAYLLCKADWERGKDRVEKFVDDQWSFS